MYSKEIRSRGREIKLMSVVSDIEGIIEKGIEAVLPFNLVRILVFIYLLLTS